MKKLLLVLPVIFLLVACGNKAVSTTNETAVNSVPQTQTQVNNNIPAEYKQVTTNENGVKIYGKIVDANTASETGKKVIEKNVRNDKEFTADHYCVYSEYVSESYGGTVIIRTDNKDGSQEVYNEQGQRFLVNDSKAAKYDLENTLAKYRLGNAMAEAIDRKVNGN